MTSKILSLFTGIGGLCEEGLDFTGLQDDYKVTQFVDISPYAQTYLAEHYWRVPVHGDIRTYQATTGQFDILCGGFPCQGTSTAGSRTGFNDPRSSLWWQMLRIIKEVKPKFLIIENPTGVIDRGLRVILPALDEIGYDAEWETITASQVGLPHRRERTFVVAYPNGIQFTQQPSPWADQVRDSITKVRFSEPERVYQPGLLEVDDGIQIEVAKRVAGNFDRRRAYGLSCSPRQAAIAWMRVDYLNKMVQQD